MAVVVPAAPVVACWTCVTELVAWELVEAVATPGKASTWEVAATVSARAAVLSLLWWL
ncbi:hypothetical protein [Nonomuraea wenchangensis]|uniref:hypothetical protein n=1 Tax=Nonomuraea wenchangensis TaxID=568860 RepID=UPI00378D21E9